MKLEIPTELANRPQWVLWELVVRKGRATKVPLRARDGRRASTTSKRDWATLDRALEGKRHHGADGIGFVFAPSDELCGVDLDACVDPESGEIHPEALAIIESIGSYTELSPSGKGLHVIFKTDKDLPGMRTQGKWGGSLEVYSQGRYFTFTGDTLPGFDHVVPSSFEIKGGESTDPQTQSLSGQAARQQLDLALKRDSELRRLFYDGYDPDIWESPSDADLSFVSRLVKAIGPNPLLIRGILKESALWRSKWETSDYFARTIAKAMDLKPADQLAQQAYERMRANEQARERIREEDATQDGFKLPEEQWTFQDELEMPEALDEYRVDDVLTSGANMLVIAQFKAGKSTLMRNLVRSLVDGDRFLGKYGVQAVTGTVCFVNYEETDSDWIRSMRAMELKNPDKLLPLHQRGKGPIPIWNDIHMRSFAQWLKVREVEVLILDTAVKAWSGYVENENDNMQVSNFALLLDELKTESGVKELVLVHHSGREGGHGRGASSLEGWMDVGIYLDVDEKSGARSIRAIGRTVGIERTGLSYEVDTHRLAIGNIGVIKAETRDKMKELRGIIELVLRDHPDGLTTRDAVEAIHRPGFNRKMIRDLLQQLAESPGSSVRVRPGDNNANVYFWDFNSNKPGR